MHILYLVPHVPNPTKRRSYLHIQGLHQQGHRVTIATLQRNEADMQHIQTLQEMGVNVLSVHLSRFQALWNCIKLLPARQPLQAQFMWSSRLMNLIEAYCKEQQPDIIHIEHLRMTTYGLRLKGRYPVLWDAVDYLTSLFEQTQQQSTSIAWRLIAKLETPRLATYEQWLTGQFPRTLVVSNRDKQGFEQDNPYPRQIQVLLQAVDGVALSNIVREKKMLILTGTMDYHPNVASVLYFVQDILPLILKTNPDVRVWIVGARPTPAIQALASANITVTGFVPSVFDYLQRATIAVAPITYAAGMQNKVLEAFLAATPVIATSKAVENLAVQAGEHLLVADTPQAFADAVNTLLQSPQQLDQIGEAGKQYVMQNHSVKQITNELLSCYAEVLSLHKTAHR